MFDRSNLLLVRSREIEYLDVDPHLLVATYRGYRSAPTAAGVSRATTDAVVTGSVVTFVFDYFITALWGV